MRAVFAVAAAVPIPFAQQLDLVVSVVAVGVAQTIEVIAFRAPAVHVEAVESVEQSHGAGDRQVDGFDLRDLSVLVQRDAQHRLIALRRDDEPALWIDGHRDPRTFAGAALRSSSTLKPSRTFSASAGVAFLGERRSWADESVANAKQSAWRGINRQQGGLSS